MTTYHNNTARTGLNAQETILRPDNVGSSMFGKLYTYPVDGEVYAQPLYVPHVDIPGKGPRKVAYIVTQHDSVYALDVDGNVDGNGWPLWKVSFIDPGNGITPVPMYDMVNDPVVPEIGITSTPVIDESTGTIYVVAKTKEIRAKIPYYFQRLHALDLRTGAEKFGGPVTIEATITGTGSGANAQHLLGFNALRQHQRAALLLSGGVVYITWAALGDVPPYHGWVMGYEATTLRQVCVFNPTPDGEAGGIWMSGCGIAADSQGSLFAVLGNGTFDAARGGRNYGSSALKLARTGETLAVADYFTPYDYQQLNAVDLDLGSGGAIVLPDQPGATPHLMVFGAKSGKLYVLNRDDLGAYRTSDDNQIVQTITSNERPLFCTPALFDNKLYFAPVADVLKVYSLDGGRVSPDPIMQATESFGYPGATASISANGNTNGIVWVLNNHGFSIMAPTVLHAYDAMDVTRELYNSQMQGERDNLGPAVRFTVPTVADGRVLVGARNQVSVLGPGHWVMSPRIFPEQSLFSGSLEVFLSTDTANADIYYTLDGNDPSEASALYTQPLVLTQPTVVRARAYKAGMLPSAVASATYITRGVVGHGSGLHASYYSQNQGQFAVNPTEVGTSSTVDYFWHHVTPDPDYIFMPYSVRWTGRLEAQRSEVHAIFLQVTGAARLWVDGDLVVDQWRDNDNAEFQANLDFEAGQRYDLQLEFMATDDEAMVRLLWSSFSTPKSVIPQTQLYPDLTADQWMTVDAPGDNLLVLTPGSFTMSATLLKNTLLVSQVEFYSNHNVLMSFTQPPYHLRVANLPAGVYELMAVVTDIYGIRHNTDPIQVFVVNEPRIQVEMQPQQLKLSWDTLSVLVVLEESDTLGPQANWSASGAVIKSYGGQSVAEVPIDAESKFYRLRVQMDD